MTGPVPSAPGIKRLQERGGSVPLHITSRRPFGPSQGRAMLLDECQRLQLRRGVRSRLCRRSRRIVTIPVAIHQMQRDATILGPVSCMREADLSVWRGLFRGSVRGNRDPALFLVQADSPCERAMFERVTRLAIRTLSWMLPRADQRCGRRNAQVEQWSVLSPESMVAKFRAVQRAPLRSASTLQIPCRW